LTLNEVVHLSKSHYGVFSNRAEGRLLPHMQMERFQCQTFHEQLVIFPTLAQSYSDGLAHSCRALQLYCLEDVSTLQNGAHYGERKYHKSKLNKLQIKSCCTKPRAAREKQLKSAKVPLMRIIIRVHTMLEKFWFYSEKNA